MTRAGRGGRQSDEHREHALAVGWSLAQVGALGALAPPPSPLPFPLPLALLYESRPGRCSLSPCRPALPPRVPPLRQRCVSWAQSNPLPPASAQPRAAARASEPRASRARAAQTPSADGLEVLARRTEQLIPALHALAAPPDARPAAAPHARKVPPAAACSGRTPVARAGGGSGARGGGGSRLVVCVRAQALLLLAELVRHRRARLAVLRCEPLLATLTALLQRPAPPPAAADTPAAGAGAADAGAEVAAAAARVLAGLARASEDARLAVGRRQEVLAALTRLHFHGAPDEARSRRAPAPPAAARPLRVSPPRPRARCWRRVTRRRRRRRRAGAGGGGWRGDRAALARGGRGAFWISQLFYPQRGAALLRRASLSPAAGGRERVSATALSDLHRATLHGNVAAPRRLLARWGACVGPFSPLCSLRRPASLARGRAEARRVSLRAETRARLRAARVRMPARKQATAQPWMGDRGVAR